MPGIRARRTNRNLRRRARHNQRKQARQTKSLKSVVDEGDVQRKQARKTISSRPAVAESIEKANTGDTTTLGCETPGTKKNNESLSTLNSQSISSRKTIAEKDIWSTLLSTPPDAETRHAQHHQDNSAAYEQTKVASDLPTLAAMSYKEGSARQLNYPEESADLVVVIEESTDLYTPISEESFWHDLHDMGSK